MLSDEKIWHKPIGTGTSFKQRSIWNAVVYERGENSAGLELIVSKWEQERCSYGGEGENVSTAGFPPAGCHSSHPRNTNVVCHLAYLTLKKVLECHNSPISFEYCTVRCVISKTFCFDFLGGVWGGWSQKKLPRNSHPGSVQWPTFLHPPFLCGLLPPRWWCRSAKMVHTLPLDLKLERFQMRAGTEGWWCHRGPSFLRRLSIQNSDAGEVRVLRNTNDGQRGRDGENICLVLRASAMRKEHDGCLLKQQKSVKTRSLPRSRSCSKMGCTWNRL